MEIISVRPLAVPDVRVIRFRRFCDRRGYFTELFRRSDLRRQPATDFLTGVEFVQGNESLSRRGVIRGLHFQWDPAQGKLVRALRGHVIDLALDVRRGSPTFGKVVAHELRGRPGANYDEWVWVPPGFAHGVCCLRDSGIEYLCSGEYAPDREAAISPLAGDIDWSLCDDSLRAAFARVVAGGPLIAEKDRDGLTVSAWGRDERSQRFVYLAGTARTTADADPPRGG